MMLMRQPTETSRGSGRTGGARLLPAAGANRSASRRGGRPADARICWIIRGTWGRITLPSRAVRPRRGATRPRLILAVPAMWKSSESTRRRGLQFDPLEGRQLLNGGYFPGPHAESASMSSGSTIGMAWVSGHDGGTASWDGAGPAIEQRGVDPQAGDAGPGGPASLGGSDWSTPGWDWSTVHIRLGRIERIRDSPDQPHGPADGPHELDDVIEPFRCGGEWRHDGNGRRRHARWIAGILGLGQ